MDVPLMERLKTFCKRYKLKVSDFVRNAIVKDLKEKERD